MLVVGADRNSLELIKGRGLKAARTEAVLKSIARDFASPGLSAGRTGFSLGITARQVHRLLEETPKTFYEHILERRLIRVSPATDGPGLRRAQRGGDRASRGLYGSLLFQSRLPHSIWRYADGRARSRRASKDRTFLTAPSADRPSNVSPLLMDAH